jgi:hypothetical protein
VAGCRDHGITDWYYASAAVATPADVQGYCIQGQTLVTK